MKNVERNDNTLYYCAIQRFTITNSFTKSDIQEHLSLSLDGQFEKLVVVDLKYYSLRVSVSADCAKCSDLYSFFIIYLFLFPAFFFAGDV